jgi:hypothetical protein
VQTAAYGEDDGGSYPAQPTFQPAAPRRYNWIWLLLGALVIAFIAAAMTAVFMKGSVAENKSSSNPPPGIAASSGAGATPSGASTPPTSSAPAASTGSPTVDASANPTGYLEGMRGQIDGFIAQGQPVLDQNTGRDLQSSLADLENSVQQAQQHGMKGRYLREVQDKTDQVSSKITDAHSQAMIGDAAASALSGELQTFIDAVSGGGGNNGNN